MKLSDLQAPDKPKMKMSDVLNGQPESVASEGWEYLENHPFKSVMQGLPETLTGKSMEDRAVDLTESKDFGQSKEKPFDKNLWFVKPVAEAMDVGGQAADIATSPSTYIPAGKIAGKVGEAIAPALTKSLKESAAKSYGKVLGATTKSEKETASKVIPGMVEKKPITFSRGTLQATAEKEMDKSGEALEKSYDDLPKDSKISIVPTIENIKKEQEGLKIKGVLPEVNKVRYAQLDKVKNDLMQVARAREVSPQTLREFRQVYDSHIVESKQGFKMTGRGGARLQAQRFIANDIRRELAQKLPNIAKLNKTYSFWSHMEELLETTGPKEKGALSSIHGFGAVRPEEIHPYLGVFINLGKLVSDNVLWNSISGSLKSRIADTIASGNFGQANKLIDSIKLLTVSKSQGQ